MAAPINGRAHWEIEFDAAGGERRNNQTYLPVGTRVTVEATCERGDPPPTSRSTETSTERTTEASTEASRSTAPDTPEPSSRNNHRRGSEHTGSETNDEPSGKPDE